MTATLPDVQRQENPVRARRMGMFVSVVAVVTVGIAAALLVAPFDRLTVGILTITLMLGLMLLKVPVGIAMALPGLLGIYVLVGSKALTGTLQDIAFNSFASWSYSVIPMFVLMGIALGKSGLMANAFESARRWLGWLPGGLAVSTNFAGAGLAATSGSSIGIAYALGRVAIPEMVRERYPISLATGSVASAGSLGMVIPPSILLVIYAGVAETSVGQQLLAGIVPGIVLALLFIIVIVLWCIVARVPRSSARYSWTERISSLTSLLPILAIVVVVLGGIYFGVFTATEAGAFGAAVTVVLGIGAVLLGARRVRATGGGTRVSPTRAVGTFFSETFRETAAAVAAIFLLLIGVLALTRVMALSGLAQNLADVIVGAGLDRVSFLLLLIPLYLFLGIFLESLPMMLLTLPVLMGPLVALDIDLLWFGIFFIIIAEIDLIAPPLGILNFVVHSIAKDTTRGMGVKVGITDVYKGVLPFIGAAIVMIVILILFPDIATWLPEVSGTR